MRTAATFATLLLVLIAAVPSRAEDGRMVRSEVQVVTFASIDRNADHRISKTEAGMYKLLIDRFALIDKDGDGFISEEELNATLTAKAEP